MQAWRQPTVEQQHPLQEGGVIATQQLWKQTAAADRGHLVSGRWSRFSVRLRQRAAWHNHGIMLWFAKRSQFRGVPVPNPSVGSVAEWLF